MTKREIMTTNDYLDAIMRAFHWRHPFGSINWVDEAGETELDEYLDSGSTVGLRRVTNLFPELQDA